MRATQTAALDYTEQGFVVIPKRGKKPALRGWKTAKHATPAEIAGWTAENIAILTGAASGNLFVLDCDGLTGYAAFRAAFPDLMNTRTVASGSGKGMHVYFMTDILPDKKRAMKIAALDNNNLELMTEGDSVVAPPSIHPNTGKPYTVHIDAPIKHLTGDETQHLINWIGTHQTARERREATRQPMTFTGNRRVSGELIQAIDAALPPHREPNGAGWINFKCILPGHDDREPSAGFNVLTGVYHCFSCGDLSAEKIAERLNIDWRRYQPKPERKPDRSRVVTSTSDTAPTVQPAPAPTVPRSWYPTLEI